MENRYKRLLGNSIWTFIGNAGSKIISFLLLPFYTKWLGTEGYGFSDLITTYASLFGGVLTLCLSDAILIFVKNKEPSDQRVFFSSAIASSLALFALWVGIIVSLRSFSIGEGYFIIDNIEFIFGMIITNFLQTSTQQMTLAIDKIKVYSFGGIILCLSIFILSYLLIPIYGVPGYVYALIIANIITSFYSMVAGKVWQFFSLKALRIDSVKELLSYSIPLIPNTIMWWLVSALNRPLMEKSLGLSAIGVFSVAQKFPAIITLLFSVFSVSWTVSVLEEYGKPRFELFYNRVFRISFCGLIICSLLLMLFSKGIIHLLTAPDFYDAYKYMVILIMGAVFSSLSAFCGTCFGVVKKSKYFFYSSLYGAITAIVLNYVLIPRFAIFGASISVSISFFVTAIARYIYSYKFVRISLLSNIIIYTVLMIGVVFTILLSESFVLHTVVVLFSCCCICFLERDSFFIIKNLIVGKGSLTNRKDEE